MDAYQVLVIILSVTLFVFLILAIIACLYIIKLLKHINNVGESVEGVVNNIRDVSDIVKKTAANTAVAGLISSFINKFVLRREDDKYE